MRRPAPRTLAVSAVVVIVLGAAAMVVVLGLAPNTPIAEREARPLIGTRLERAFTLSEPRRLLRDLGLPARTEIVGPIVVSAADGPAPEMQAVALRTLLTRTELRNHYRAACSAQGLEVQTDALEPNQICHAPRLGLQILLSPCVAKARCDAYLEVRAF